ncbi:MAG: Hemolysin-type calcium-binding region [Labilithrix sp.]|nr:Hemolysin-type calcium-binding region [Labilithrix sp.]
MAHRVAEPAAFMSSLRRVTALAWAPMLTLLVWGCATSGTGDIGPATDPTLPEVDASWAPSPGKSSKKDAGSSSGSEEEDEPTNEEEPPKTAAPDGGTSSTDPPAPSTPKPAQGEVLITEVMYDPFTNEPASEWIELHNTTTAARSLAGITIVDGGNRTHVIGGGLTVAAGAYVVLARNTVAATAAKVPAAAIVYEYGTGLPDTAGIQLANGTSGGVSLKNGTSVIAQADYGGWYSQSGGSSVQLETLTYNAGLQSSSWCISLKPWTTGADKGTPGAPSDCP